MNDSDFITYPKTPRLFREIVVTEKLDGTNSSVFIDETGRNMSVGSRNRWITPTDDNFGFAKWCNEHFEELLTLGPGRHFGEWWGNGIQRGYGLKEKRFSLFNVARWSDGAVTTAKWEKGVLIPGGQPLSPRPACCHVVPVLFRGGFNTGAIDLALYKLGVGGSAAVPGFMRPEGIIVFYTAVQRAFKVLLENDADPKGTGE